ncbi:MAG: SIMPL domain-containing protein [Firmicutes bacterium]|mgnify:CR=1 FL=1|nr:SIMPL domain-containing protein [Bacillota bacterium]
MLLKSRNTIVILLVLSLILGTAALGAAEEGEKGSLRVTGQAVISGRPDLALITLGVETKDPSAEAASQENAERMASVLEALQELGLEKKDLETGGYNIYSTTQVINRGTDKEETVTLYQAQNRLLISTKNLDQVGQIIDAAVKAGANQVQGVRFDLSDKQELQLLALEKAVAQARSKAEVMAAGAGVALGGLISLQEEYGTYAPALDSLALRAYGAKEEASTVISPGEIEVSAQVNLVFWF